MEPSVTCMRCVPIMWCEKSHFTPVKIWDDVGAGGGKPGSIWVINSLGMNALNTMCIYATGVYMVQVYICYTCVYMLYMYIYSTDVYMLHVSLSSHVFLSMIGMVAVSGGEGSGPPSDTYYDLNGKRFFIDAYQFMKKGKVNV